MSKVVSVVIPAYNAEEYIEKCINSLVVQTYKNLEIIIVNDGSTDSTQEICEKLVKTDSRISLINQKNGGVSAARNSGIAQASGKYICFVDADDLVYEAYVEGMYSNCEKYQSDLTICGYEEKKDGRIVEATSGRLQVMTQKVAMENLLRKDSFQGYSVNKLFSMDIIRTHNIKFDTDIKIWEDVLFVFKYLLHCEKIVYDPEPMYTYIYVPNSISHLDNYLIGIENAYSAIRAKDKIVELLPPESDLIKKQLSIRYVQSSLSVIRNIGYNKNKDYNDYYVDCINRINQHKKTAYKSLTIKDKILVSLCMTCPELLMLLYRIVSGK